MDKMELKALGKINLGLDVLGRRENGYGCSVVNRQGKTFPVRGEGLIEASRRIFCLSVFLSRFGRANAARLR